MAFGFVKLLGVAMVEWWRNPSPHRDPLRCGIPRDIHLAIERRQREKERLEAANRCQCRCERCGKEVMR